MSFEDDLRSALRREAAPDGFAERVIALARSGGAASGGAKRPIPIALWRRPLVWAIAAGLLVAAAIPPAASEYRRRREERAMAAKQELLLALTVTRVKLRKAQEKIQRTQRRAL